MTLTHQLRKRLFKPEQAELGDHARDVQDILGKVPVIDQRIVEANYSEPMTLQAAEEPFSIELVRIMDLRAPEQPVSACFGMVHYVWRPQLGGAQITKLGGMSIASNGGNPYRFFYRITYRMVK